MSFWPKESLSICRNFLELFIWNSPRILLKFEAPWDFLVITGEMKTFSFIVAPLIKLT